MPKSTEVAKPFDATEFQERITKKIQAEFVNLIPDEAFATMVSDALNRFTKRQPYQRYSGSPTEYRPSEFDRIALEVFEEWVKAELKLVLESPEWRGQWDDGKEHATPAIMKLLKDNAGEIVANVLGGAMQLTLSDARNRL